MLLTILLIPTACQALTFPPIAYSENDILVNVVLTADLPWSVPTVGHVDLNLEVIPRNYNITVINVTRVDLVVYDKQSESNFLIVASDMIKANPIVSGPKPLNFTLHFNLSITRMSIESYFAIMVSGSYLQLNESILVQSSSNETFIGPIQISYGMTSPVVLVGVAFIIITTVLIVGGVKIVRRDVKRRKRRGLLEE